MMTIVPTSVKISAGEQTACCAYIKFKIFIIFIFLIMATWICIYYYKASARRHLYDQSEIGDDFSIHYKKSDAIVRWQDKDVLYFFGHGPFSGKSEIPPRIESLSDLPFVYDAMQFMLDPNGHLIAKGWCGETTTVEFRGGIVKGSALSQMPKDADFRSFLGD